MLVNYNILKNLAVKNTPLSKIYKIMEEPENQHYRMPKVWLFLVLKFSKDFGTGYEYKEYLGMREVLRKARKQRSLLFWLDNRAKMLCNNVK